MKSLAWKSTSAQVPEGIYKGTVPLHKTHPPTTRPPSTHAATQWSPWFLFVLSSPCCYALHLIHSGATIHMHVRCGLHFLFAFMFLIMISELSTLDVAGQTWDVWSQTPFQGVFINCLTPQVVCMIDWITIRTCKSRCSESNCFSAAAVLGDVHCLLWAVAHAHHFLSMHIVLSGARSDLGCCPCTKFHLRLVDPNVL